MNFNSKENSVEEHIDDSEIVITTGQGNSQVDEYRMVKQLFTNCALMIRWFLLRYLNGKDVMRLTSV